MIQLYGGGTSDQDILLPSPALIAQYTMCLEATLYLINAPSSANKTFLVLTSPPILTNLLSISLVVVSGHNRISTKMVV